MTLTSWLQLLGQSQRRVRRTQRSPAVVESLENRSLLSVAALFVNGELFVGSDGGDSITIRQNTNARVEVLANGVVLGTAPNVLTSAVTKIVVKGGDEANVIDLNAVTNSTYPNLTSILIDSDDGDDVITGSPTFADSVLASDGNDILLGQGGNDTLDGGDGDDSITGSDGDDSLIGEDGSDTITGDAGNDTILGGDHADLLNGGDGDDSIDAGLSNDTVSGGNGNDSIFGSEGVDSLLGDAGADSITGGLGNDALFGGDDNDTLDGQAGLDSINGDAGDDSLIGGGGNDSMSGGIGNDTANGNAGNDSIFGDAGNDSLIGGSGNDAIQGVDGDDIANGQGGNDTIIGDSGSDTLDGGSGNDLVSDLDPSLAVLPTLSVSNVSVTEGNAGSVNATFTVSLSSPSAVAVTVGYSTKDGTALAGRDYAAQSNSLTFQPGETSKSVTVAVNGDLRGEVDEVFFLDLGVPTNAVLLAPEGVATIRNDDGQTTNRLLGALTQFPAELYEVDTTTAAVSFIGNIGTDFVLGLTTNPANVVYATRRDPLVGLITVNTSTGQGTLVGELNPQPTEVIEGDLAYHPTNNLIYAVFSGPFPNLYTIDPLTAASVNLGPLLFGGVPLTPQANNINFDGLVFRGNELYGYIPDNIPGVGDSLLRIDLTTREMTNVGAFGVDLPRGGGALAYDPIDDVFYVTQSGQSALSAGPMYRVDPLTGAATIVGVSNTPIGLPGFRGMTFETVPVTDPVALSISDATVSDASNAATTATLTVTLSRSLVTPVTIDATTLSGTALSGSDFAPVTQTLVFLPGQTSQTISIPVLADSLAEPTESFFVQLSNPTGSLITDALGRVTISDGGLSNTLLGGTGLDTVIGGSAADFINGGNDADSLLGLAGNDSILGGSGPDTINGGDGSDTINGQGGVDVIDGGNGDDALVWEGDGSGNDTLDNAAGFDTVLVNLDNSAETVAIGQTAIPLAGTFGFMQITEGAATVTLLPSIANVEVNGNGGADTITIGDLEKVNRTVLTVRGGDGNDFVTAIGANTGTVRLRLEGGDGDDTLIGGKGNDTLVGEAGIDRLRGGDGNDVAFGGVSIDSISGEAGNDTLFGGDGTETNLADGSDTLEGGAGNDSIRGEIGNDSIVAGDGDDTVRGGDGNDTMAGELGNDSLLGDTGNDNLDGGDGNDTLDGGRSNDLMNGGAGNDKMRGDHGDDTMLGGAGADTMNGGDGNDTVNGQAGNDLLAGADGDDFVNGGDNNDTMTGGDGDDTMLGGNGNDILLGEQGDDVVNGQSSTDTVAGGQGDDTLVGALPSEIDEQFVLSAALVTALSAM